METHGSNQIETDIRANIIWGEDPEEIRRSYLDMDFAPEIVDSIIRDALAERKVWFHQKGVRDLLYGSCFVVGFLLLLFTKPDPNSISSIGSPGSGWMAGLIGMPCGAVFFFIRGLSRIWSGGRGEKSS